MVGVVGDMVKLSGILATKKLLATHSHIPASALIKDGAGLLGSSLSHASPLLAQHRFPVLVAHGVYFVRFEMNPTTRSCLASP